MPYTVTSFEPTPNPNAVKCLLDRPASDRPRSFRCAEEAADDPIAAELFRIEGVNNVLINGDWISVGKTPESDWRKVKDGVARVLAQAP